MGRVREHISVKGQKFWTLFDTGARNTSIVPSVAALLATWEMLKPFQTALGGIVRHVTQAAGLDAEIEGHKISTHAMVLDDIGTSARTKMARPSKSCSAPWPCSNGASVRFRIKRSWT